MKTSRDIEIHVIKSKYNLKQALEHMHRFWMTAMPSPAFCPKPVFMVSNLTSILANEPWSGKSFEHWTMTALTMEVLVGSLTWFELCQPSSSQVTFGYGSGNSIFPGLFGYALSAWQKTRRKSLVMTFGTWCCLLVQKHSLPLDLALIRAQVVSSFYLTAHLCDLTLPMITWTLPTSNGKSTNPGVFLNTLGKNWD